MGSLQITSQHIRAAPCHGHVQRARDGLTMHMMMYRMVQTVVAPTMPMGMSLAGFFACSRTSPQSWLRHQRDQLLSQVTQAAHASIKSP